VLSFSQRLWQAVSERWREQSNRGSALSATADTLRAFAGFLHDSTPERRRSRYGDMDYDWEHRVDTTSGSVGWQDRLLGVFHSPYQPTDAALFQEMMDSLPIDSSQFTFIDIGSGKGRTLLMASEYPFRRIVGVEILAGLDEVAQRNVAEYQGSTAGERIQAICMDAADYMFPEEPLVIYLFNPLPEPCLRKTLQRLEDSLTQTPHAAWIVYHNPLLETVLEGSRTFVRVTGTPQYSIYRVRAH
jgi:hypothetical protein